ncbi:hypothetical protein BN1708_005014, partial [Verticillium longisporum]
RGVIAVEKWLEVVSDERVVSDGRLESADDGYRGRHDIVDDTREIVQEVWRSRDYWKQATQSDEPLGRADYVPSSEVVASVDVGECGMFGGIPLVKGFGNPSKVHLHGSRSFVIQMGAGLKIVRQSIDYALEGGAGIDRVGVEPVLHVAKEVGVIEPFSSSLWR